MKALVIYDTVYGNTKEVAETIAVSLSKSIAAEARYVLHVSLNDLVASDIIIIGSPTHYWRETKKTRDFLLSLSRLKLRPMAATYCTRMQGSLAGSAAAKLSNLARKIGLKTLGKPLNIFVESFKGPLKPGEKQTAERYAEFIASDLTQMSSDKNTDTKSE